MQSEIVAQLYVLMENGAEGCRPRFERGGCILRTPIRKTERLLCQLPRCVKVKMSPTLRNRL